MPLDRDLSHMLLAEMETSITRKRQRNMFEMFPDKGPLSFDKYPKHMEFFNVSRDYMEICFMAANRVGKTMAACYAAACHLTGWYPWWWRGRRFNRPITAIVAGRNNKNTRDIFQRKLLGEVVQIGNRKRMDGSGMLPGEWVGLPSWSQVADLIDTVQITCLHGGKSRLRFKSYEQGPGAFEGSEEDLICLDEEPPMDVYGEALMRLTSTTGNFEDMGLLLLTFTPLLGYSEVVMQFIPEDMRPMAPPSVGDDFYADA